MSLVHEQAAFLGDVAKLVAKSQELGFLATGGELERSSEAQAQRVKLGLDKSMDSAHLRRCAIDLHFFQEGAGDPEWIGDAARLEPLGSFWESLDPRNAWGGRGSDVDGFRHFERGLGGWPSTAGSKLLAPAGDAAPLAPTTPDRPSGVPMPTEAGAPPVLRRGISARADVLRLQEKLVQAGRIPQATGIFDAATEAAVADFQRDGGLVADGVVGVKTWSLLLAAPPKGNAGPPASRWLSDSDIEAAAQGLGVESDSLRAVYRVESSGHGFVDDRPRTLFEGHVFWKRLQAAGIDPRTVAKGNEDIVYPQWTRQFYGRNAAQERDRLRRAEAIHTAAARESASWGLFQIMGHHWKDLEIYASVDDFVDRMSRHERDQLEAFCRFVVVTRSQGRPLREHLERKDWAAFAYGYNGSGYRQNRYDDRLREEYAKVAAAR